MKRRNTAILTLHLLVSALAIPATAQDAATPPVAAGAEASQVVRPGDDAMSCEALALELTRLNSELTAVQMQMNDQATAMSLNSMQGGAQANSGLSTALGVAGVAAAFVPGAGLAMGVIGAASTANMQSSMAAQAEQNRERADIFGNLNATVAQLQPLGQRIDHLSAISRARPC